MLNNINMPIFILIQCVAMVVMTIANIGVGQIRIVINQERECRRLRIAMRAELVETPAAAFSSCLSRRSHLDCRARVMSLAADLRRPSPSTKAC